MGSAYASLSSLTMTFMQQERFETEYLVEWNSAFKYKELSKYYGGCNCNLCHLVETHTVVFQAHVCKASWECHDNAESHKSWEWCGFREGCCRQEGHTLENCHNNPADNIVDEWERNWEIESDLAQYLTINTRKKAAAIRTGSSRTGPKSLKTQETQ